jgi:hypothetical protein
MDRNWIKVVIQRLTVTSIWKQICLIYEDFSMMG